jgi:hypothetical protein
MIFFVTKEEEMEVGTLTETNEEGAEVVLCGGRTDKPLGHRQKEAWHNNICI